MHVLSSNPALDVILGAKTCFSVSVVESTAVMHTLSPKPLLWHLVACPAAVGPVANYMSQSKDLSMHEQKP
jgi:hypothetical protein